MIERMREVRDSSGLRQCALLKGSTSMYIVGLSSVVSRLRQQLRLNSHLLRQTPVVWPSRQSQVAALAPVGAQTGAQQEAVGRGAHQQRVQVVLVRRAVRVLVEARLVEVEARLAGIERHRERAAR